MRFVVRNSFIFGLLGGLAAFGQLKGRVEQSQAPPLSEIYKSQDPTKGRPQVMRAASGPNGTECIPPKTGNWKLVARIGDTCYWFEPYVVFEPGYVVPIGDIRRVPGKCGRHPWDNRLAVCDAPAGAQVDDPYANYQPGPCELGHLSPVERRAVLYSAEYRKNCVFAGGYDPENNPGRAGSGQGGNANRGGGPPVQAPVRPPVRAKPQPPLDASVEYARGVAEGVGECVKGFGDMFAGAQYAMRLDFVNAAETWGLKPGQSMTLQGILMEARAPSVGAGVTPNDAGKIAGRRLCAFVIVPGMAKGVGGYFKKIARVGETPVRPISGATVLEGVAEEATAKTLAGKWILTPTGPVKLGKFVGRGSFGTVYEAADPSKVIKIGNKPTTSAESFARQQEGSRLLEKAGIPTPKIHEFIQESPGHPPILVMDNALRKWPGAVHIPDGDIARLSPGQRVKALHAIEDLGNELADAGLVLADNHGGNSVFLPQPGGGWRAIIVDADFLGPVEALTHAPSLSANPVINMAVTVLHSFGKFEHVTSRPTTAHGWADVLYRARYGDPIGRGGGTVPIP